MLLLQVSKYAPSVGEQILSVLGILIAIFTPFTIGYVYSVAKIRRWENSILPKEGEFTQHDFMIGYICVATQIIKLDPRNFDEKRVALQRALIDQKINTSQLWTHFDRLLQSEIRLKHVAAWAKLRLSKQERESLLFLLIELSLIDEVLLAKEFDLLHEFAHRTDISLKQLNSMIASQKQRMVRERIEAEQKRREHQQRISEKRSQSEIDRAFEVLGLSSNASADEIKKAYRKLVKKYHPDRYIGHKEEVIASAQQQFIEIQQAYELISAA